MATKQSSMVDVTLLNKIDTLFACGVGDQIALPQLVVVGDQSSGKSSVLEGLTSLPFPRDSGLCTRFATQITFRRAPCESLAISIIPAASSDAAYIAKVQAWKKEIRRMEPQAFAEIMREVHEVMNLGSQASSGGKKTFSEDVLKLDVCGPEQEHFSVVDVPGIFRKATEGLTTKGDLEMVRNMVSSYMENPRSVMLAVVPANVDIATQEILTMAEEYDQDGVRTIGVLTKPDLVDAGAERPVIDLLTGQKHQLNLGWYAVRNLGQSQIEDAGVDRNALELAFFRQKKPWNTVEEDKVGIASLRARLEEVLANHIRREFPKVKTELNKRLHEKKLLLDKLGPSRATRSDQFAYLLDISMRFRDITSMALNAQFTSTAWFDECKTSRLATAVVNRNESMADTLARHGHSYAFEEEANNDDAPAAVPESPSPESDDVSKNQTKTFTLREVKSHPDLAEIALAERDMSSNMKRKITSWLRQVHRSSRGFEIGIFNSTLLATTMKTQSAKWEPIALGYINDIISIVHAFIVDLLRYACPDSRVRTGILSTLMEALLQKYTAAINHVNFLLDVERSGTPTTMNHYFTDNLTKSRQHRMRTAAMKKSWVHTDSNYNSIDLVRVDELDYNPSMSNVDHVVVEVHDILKSYYKVARKRFADCLCIQAADYYLVKGPESPLKLFSPSFVGTLSDIQLAEIAGEEAATASRRQALNKAIGILEAGKRILM